MKIWPVLGMQAAKQKWERVPEAGLRGKALVVILVAAKVMGWGGLVNC
jgi:hypothetical protein